MISRNALLIVVDEWRFDALSALGDTIVKTPNLDRLMALGATFRNAFTVVSPCGPARASLLTGLYAFRHGVLRNGLPPKSGVRFVNEDLEAAGILPILCGYSTTAPVVRPDGQGRAHVLHNLNYHAGFYPLAAMIPQRFPYRGFLASHGVDIPNPFEDLWLPDDRDDIPPGYGISARRARLPVALWDNAFYAGAAEGFLKSGWRDPWFLLLTFMRPHPPFIVPEPYHRLHHPDEMSLPRRAATPQAESQRDPRVARWIAENEAGDFLRGETGLMSELNDLDTRQVIATYYGMMAELDTQIGRVLDALEANGQSENTLVILTSDHGELLGDHWLFGKQAWFDAAYRIPMIVVDPTVPASERGIVCDDLVECCDVTATLLDWFGLKARDRLDGCSLLPRLSEHQTPLARSHVFFELDDPSGRLTGIHTGTQKAIFAHNGEGHVHYDLANDPDETAPLPGLGGSDTIDRLVGSLV